MGCSWFKMKCKYFLSNYIIIDVLIIIMVVLIFMRLLSCIFRKLPYKAKFSTLRRTTALPITCPPLPSARPCSPNRVSPRSSHQPSQSSHKIQSQASSNILSQRSIALHSGRNPTTSKVVHALALTTHISKISNRRRLILSRNSIWRLERCRSNSVLTRVKTTGCKRLRPP